MKDRIQFLAWAKNCVRRAIVERDVRYLRIARSHIRSAFGR
jgi:hypothetical protein